MNLLIHFTNFIHFNFSIEVKHCLLTAHGSIKWKSVYPQRKFQVSSCRLLLNLKVDNCWELYENKQIVIRPIVTYLVPCSVPSFLLFLPPHILYLPPLSSSPPSLIWPLAPVIQDSYLLSSWTCIIPGI